ncbi:FAD synthetase [Geosmithia morbida]|uniref:FAD synthase n=1 Tax=Geosmithia morbida TaxID=1094350 RepID=A0A9P4YPF3_9HYPO|nr:FAD synthetase [Geosmithia morbida]KAF4120147.1 FAD synthetase [Geosmithia morbida]
MPEQSPLQQGRDISEAHGDQTNSFPQTCWALRRKVLAFLEAENVEDKALRTLQGHIRVAMEVIGEALHRYGLEHLSLSYNGGKDCLVLLILILACLPELDEHRANGRTNGDHQTVPDSQTTPLKSETLVKPLQAIYIVSRDPFPEVEEFVASSANQYHLSLERQELPMRQALDAYLSEKTDVKAIFLGTRRSDPHCDALGHFSPTDAGWPQFMRVNPIIDWHYVDIWLSLMPKLENTDQPMSWLTKTRSDAGEGGRFYARTLDGGGEYRKPWVRCISTVDVDFR